MQELDPIRQVRSTSMKEKKKEKKRKDSHIYLKGLKQVPTAVAIKSTSPHYVLNFFFFFCPASSFSLQLPYNFMAAVVRQSRVFSP